MSWPSPKKLMSSICPTLLVLATHRHTWNISNLLNVVSSVVTKLQISTTELEPTQKAEGADLLPRPRLRHDEISVAGRVSGAGHRC